MHISSTTIVAYVSAKVEKFTRRFTWRQVDRWEEDSVENNTKDIEIGGYETKIKNENKQEIGIV